MKKVNQILGLVLPFILVMSMNATIFGAALASDKLYNKASKAQSSASYRYSGTLTTDTTVTIGGEGVKTTDTVDIEAMGTGKGNSYTVSTGEVDGVKIVTESLMQNGTLYVRSFKEGMEKPSWLSTVNENMMQGDLLSNFQEYVDSESSDGLNYSYGKSKLINGIEHTQIIINMDDTFIQKTMAPMTEVISENIIGTMAAQSSQQEKAYMTALIGELYKTMATDMKISCFINPRTALFHSMIIDGSIQMNLMGMSIASKTYGEFTFDYTTVSLPAINNN